MRHILVFVFYIFTSSIGYSLDIAEFEKELMNVIYHGCEQFLGKLDNFDCMPLNGGLSSNVQYLCVANDKKYVARVIKKPQNQRTTEIAVHVEAMRCGISPVVHYHYSNHDYSVMIMDFIDDHTLWVQQADLTDVLNKIASTLRVISQFDPNILTDQTPKNLFEKINNYYRKLKKLELKNLEPMLDQALHIVEILNQRLSKDKRVIFSHADLNPRNIFFMDNNIVLIDWEHACMHYDLHDVASYSVFLCLEERQDIYLLTQYLQHKPSSAEIQRLKDIKLMIRAINAFWGFNFLQKIPDAIPIESIKEFKYYETILAQDSQQNSDEFLYALSVSQLKKFFQEYEKSSAEIM